MVLQSRPDDINYPAHREKTEKAYILQKPFGQLAIEVFRCHSDGAIVVGVAAPIGLQLDEIFIGTF